MRICTNTCLYGVPPIYSGRVRPPKHGKKFKIADPLTWAEPEFSLELSDLICVQVRVRMWTGLYFMELRGFPST